MNKLFRFRWLGACAAAAAAVSALAPAIAQSLPPMKTAGAVHYSCGGIGSDESTAMRAAMKDHPLALLFARADGAYLAEVQVQIKGSGEPVSFTANGPVCLVDLPKGRYTVEASTEGARKSQAVEVGSGPRTADFRF